MLDVLGGKTEEVRVVFEVAETVVAVDAEHVSKLAAGMTMVEGVSLVRAAQDARSLSKRVVLLGCYPVLPTGRFFAGVLDLTHLTNAVKVAALNAEERLVGYGLHLMTPLALVRISVFEGALNSFCRVLRIIVTLLYDTLVRTSLL